MKTSSYIGGWIWIFLILLVINIFVGIIDREQSIKPDVNFFIRKSEWLKKSQAVITEEVNLLKTEQSNSAINIISQRKPFVLELISRHNAEVDDYNKILGFYCSTFYRQIPGIENLFQKHLAFDKLYQSIH